MMGNLIFLIIIIIVLRNVIEKKKSDSEKENGQRFGSHSRSGGLPENTAAMQSNPAVRKTASPVSKQGTTSPGNRETAQKSAAGSSRIAAREADAKKETKVRETISGVTAKAQEAEQISTTEYLRQKALEDQKEHEEEARLEAIRLHRETGGRRAAQRHYDGDSIPKGMRLVKCGYCGAENLIGDYQNQKDFTCYFCREIL